MTRRVTYFNPRTPVGCDHPHAALWSASIGNFNPRTPVGCDRSSRRCARPSGYFNPRTPVGCDRRLRLMAYRDSLFQSTHPSGVRQAQNRGHAATDNFNPRTPVGCDHAPRSRSARLLISIHAPQWGATWMFCNMPVLSDSFQSTHPSGVRRAWTSTSYWIRNFNPRTPVGCDHPAAPVRGNPVISIHAPQWGATGAGGKPPPCSLEFQSTHPSGVRPLRSEMRCHVTEFQSTHPSGVRHARKGRQKPPVFISIHAPQWGATGLCGNERTSVVISIHAPQWGATRSKRTTKTTGIYFNPRTPVGCDRTLWE